MLRDFGAVIIDADVIGHEVYEIGRPAHLLVIARFGEKVLAPDGAIDRKALAEKVFSDAEARRDLEAIVHPEVFREITSRIASHNATRDIVIVDAPLLVETLGTRRKGPLNLDSLVVVSSSSEDQIERLVRDRSMPAEAASARIDAQAPLESKIAAADYVIHNSGDLENLRASVEVLWKDLATNS